MDTRYFLSRFWRRIHWFLLVAILISGAALVVARELPPTYVSSANLLVEQAQIDDATVRLSARAQLELVRERLTTRANLLEIARRHRVFEGIDLMTPDDIVSGMRSATNLAESSGRGSGISRMTMSFTARSGQIAAAVLNDYLTIVQEEDAQIGTVAAAQTLEFYDEEVERLSALLDQRAEAILAFQSANSDALPSSLNARLSQQSNAQERLLQIARDLSTLERQREQTLRLFEITAGASVGEGGGQPSRASPAERELETLQRELEIALITFAASNPRIRVLEGRVAAAERAVEIERETAQADAVDAVDMATAPDPQAQRNSALLDVQIAEFDARREALEQQRTSLEDRLVELEDVLSRIPANEIALSGLEREYANVRSQYNRAVGLRASAATGERIEVLSRGQRIVVTEPPAVPSSPTGPNRLMIAGGGGVAGVAAGLALVILLELLNRVPKRPVDLTSRFGITPIATIPYVPTRGQTLRRRATKLIIIATGLALGPAALWLVHTQYRPLDLLLRDLMRMAGL